MSTPIIGITTFNQKNRYGFPVSSLMHKYSMAILEAGGAPVLIPTIIPGQTLYNLLNRLDGIMFSGGGDMDPACYNSESHPMVDDIDHLRDDLEIALVKEVAGSGKPFLGICRGAQVVNVALGGSLYTHIPDQHPHAIKHNYHSGTERELLAHEVDLVAESRLSGIFGEIRLRVNSLHHQGVMRLAEHLRLVGVAPDGLPEAFELPGHPFGVAVQWHPEWLTGYVHARRLFTAFVDACRI